jgi:hypothetical protein
MTAIHEIQQVLWVNTPHGMGQALFIIDYGPHENTYWLVVNRETGKINHYDSNQITVSRNYTLDMNMRDG